MREIIQKLVESEAEARRLVAAAKLEAGNLIAKAQTQAQALMAEARREMPGEAERIIQTALEDAEREKRARVAAAAVQIESELKLDAATTEQLVAAGVRSVCGGPL